MSGSVELIDVSKLYGDVHAVDRVSLTIKEGEFSLCSGLQVREKPPVCV